MAHLLRLNEQLYEVWKREMFSKMLVDISDSRFLRHFLSGHIRTSYHCLITFIFSVSPVSTLFYRLLPSCLDIPKYSSHWNLSFNPSFRSLKISTDADFFVAFISSPFLKVAGARIAIVLNSILHHREAICRLSWKITGADSFWNDALECFEAVMTFKNRSLTKSCSGPAARWHGRQPPGRWGGRRGQPLGHPFKHSMQNFKMCLDILIYQIRVISLIFVDVCVCAIRMCGTPDQESSKARSSFGTLELRQKASNFRRVLDAPGFHRAQSGHSAQAAH